MKILLTIEDISYGRGAERVTVNFANALCECGHEVSILSFYQRHPNLPYTDINPSVKLFFRYNYEQSIAQEWSKKQFFKGFYYKNIHKLILSYELKNADYDFIISSGFAYFPYFKNKKTKYIKIIHTNFHRYSSRNALFDTLAVLSTKELDIWQKYHKSVMTIPNFIPEIPSKCTNHTQRFILSVGRLSKEKGFFRLLDIWKIVQDRIKDSNMNCESTHSVIANEVKQSTMFQNGLPRFCVAKSHNDSIDSQNLTQWKLIIVGDGVLKKELESKIKALNLQESVILKPFTKQIEKEYLSASIYAMSSHFEGFGMVLAEASSYALPCVAFDVKTGPSDIIENEKSGFLVEDNDLQGYADKLMLLMRDENLRFNFGTKAKRVVSERFSKEVVMKMWEKLFIESAKS